MDRLLRPSAAAGLVIAIAFIALLVGFPSLAARMSANRVQAATAPSTGKTASMEPAKVEHAGGGHAGFKDKAILERGKETYVKYCASCHARRAWGMARAAPTFPSS